MLTSMVFVLRPSAQATIPKTLGNAFYSFFLDLVGQYDTELATALHDMDGPKPFTTSPLQGPVTPRGDNIVVYPDQDYWLRVTSIADYLSTILSQIEAAPPSTVPLYRAQFNVQQTSSQADDHPWASHLPYHTLYESALQSVTVARPQVSMKFESPTAFSSQGRTQILPLPRLVFGSLLTRWNRYAPFPMDDSLLDAFETDIDIDRYELNTQMQHFKRYRLQPGFVGSCTFGVRKGTPDDVVWGMRLLAQFAAFAGVGTRTTMGMGQVRLDIQSSLRYSPERNAWQRR